MKYPKNLGFQLEEYIYSWQDILNFDLDKLVEGVLLWIKPSTVLQKEDRIYTKLI